MRTLSLAIVTVLVVVGTAGVAAGSPAAPAPAATDAPAASTSAEVSTADDACAAFNGGDAPADPESDVLGWENGCWYNESLDVDRSDGLNESELDAVVSRAMARVEQVRQLEFEKQVPVEVIARETYVESLDDRSEEPSASNFLHQNAKWEAMFMVNESADAIAVQQSSRGASVGGFYSPTEERIVIISENATSPKMNEITLSQELFHALQDQQFDLSGYNQSTRELHNAKDGIIEGDGNYVDYLYSQRCDSEWDCLLPEASGGGGGGDVHTGILVTQFVPYSEGPEFVKEIHENQGWDAVNAIYENPPASTEQIIHPEKYGTDEPTTVRIEHTPSNGWGVLQLEGGLNYAQFGEGGLYAMLWYSSYEASVEAGAAETVGIPYRHLFQYKKGTSELRDIGPYNYNHPATDGWEGDKLVPYVKGDTTKDAPSGYVWKIQWESNEDAQEFAEAYTNVLDYHGAEAVDGRADTYRIPDENEFGDAFYVSVEGSTVVVVNGPDVQALSDIREGAAPSVSTSTPTPTATATATPTATETSMDDTETNDGTGTEDGTDASSPGFGLAAALVALLAVVVLARRRH